MAGAFSASRAGSRLTTGVRNPVQLAQRSRTPAAPPTHAACRSQPLHRRRSRRVRGGVTMAAAAGADVSAPKPSVAVLGIGLMGNKMARRLQQEGFTVAVWNRTLEKADPLAAAGCRVATSAETAIQQSDVIITVLSDAGAIEEAVLSGGAKAALAGRVVLQMGTIGPDESRQIAAAVGDAGGTYVEAPVLGSQPEAEKGTLLVMVGCEGDAESSRAWPVLKALGEEPLRIGEVGTAAAVKLALNQLIASLTVGFSTSLGLLQRNNVDIDAFMKILRPSALYAPTFDKKLQRMLDREYSNPNFPTKHLLKDIRLFEKEAHKAKLNTALLTGLEAVVASTVDRGLDNTDYSAVHDGIIEPDGGASSS